MKQKAWLGQLADTDIRLLRVFKSVAESGGISAAELELNIGRSTISRHIKDLELRLGVTLCRRGRSGFALTREGTQIYQSTLRLIGSLDEFRADVNDLHQRLTGSFTLALFDKTVSNPDCFIHAALALFDQQAPDVDIEIYIEPLNEIERGVIEGRFQCGVIPSHRNSSSLAYMPLFNETMQLFCGVQHSLFAAAKVPVSDAEITACKYAGLGYHSPNMEVGRKLGLNRSATVYDQEAILHLLLSGVYIGYLPDHYAKPFVESGLLCQLKNPNIEYPCQFEAIWRKSPKPSRVQALFLSCLEQVHAQV